jgi:hypothetical protein
MAGLNQSVRNKVLEAFKDGRRLSGASRDRCGRRAAYMWMTSPRSFRLTRRQITRRMCTAPVARLAPVLPGSVVTLALPHQRKAMERIIDEVALSISPERMDNASAAAEGIRPTGAPVPEAWWQEIIAPRPQRGRRGPRSTAAGWRPSPPDAMVCAGDGPRRPRY